jgi:dTDP-4-amino-4,6-dideoxygalactose transaminase
MIEKRSIDDLAILGGKPMFERARPIGQLARPNAARFFELAKGCFERRRLSNNGPVVQELEERLAGLHQVEHCVAYANAGLALIATIDTLVGGRTGKVVIPTFTYTGLPHIVRWAGQTPRFCDVDADTHTLTAQTVSAVLEDDTVLVLGVHQANSPCPIAPLEALCASHGIPLLFDSVHGLGASYRNKAIGQFGRAEVFSLHATKILNGFEGGYVTTNDSALAALLQRKRNFGYTGEASIDTLGMNGKLNELHAASALAALDDLPAILARNRERVEGYRQAFSGIDGISWIPYPEDDATNFEFPLMRLAPDYPIPRNVLVSILRAEGALARPYYSPVLHLQDDPLHPPLPVSEALARCIVQMPTGEMVDQHDIKSLAALVEFVSDNAEQVCAGIQEGTRSE